MALNVKDGVVAVVAAIGVGSVLYVVGAVGATVSPAISPVIMFAVGFACTAAAVLVGKE
jgi:hypothetical protein